MRVQRCNRVKLEVLGLCNNTKLKPKSHIFNLKLEYSDVHVSLFSTTLFSSPCSFFLQLPYPVLIPNKIFLILFFRRQVTELTTLNQFLLMISIKQKMKTTRSKIRKRKTQNQLKNLTQILALKNLVSFDEYN